jgi:hypothetical protein
MKKAVVGGVLSMDSGRRYGFKVSFVDIEDAMYYNGFIVKVLEKENLVVDVERRYHES